MDVLKYLVSVEQIDSLWIAKPNFNDPAVKQLIHEAGTDEYLGEAIMSKRLDNLRLLTWKGELVGFAMPRREADGRYRTGAIFISAPHRKQGIAQVFVKQYFEGRKGRAWIDDANHASRALFGSVGFAKSGKTLRASDGDTLYEYLKD